MHFSNGSAFCKIRLCTSTVAVVGVGRVSMTRGSTTVSEFEKTINKNVK